MPSSVIRNFNYRPDLRQLRLTFTSGRCYLYFDVPPDEVERLSAAPSQGSYFNLSIRDHYAYRELGRPARR